jgi:hypothetical protein
MSQVLTWLEIVAAVLDASGRTGAWNDLEGILRGEV